MKTPLYLHEEFMLLALREDAGTVATSESIEFPLAAAVVSELMLQKRVELKQVKKDNQEVNLVDSSSLDDPILDEAMQKIAEAKRPASLQKWVERLAEMKDLKHRTAIQLCRRGILRADVGKRLKEQRVESLPVLSPASVCPACSFPERHNSARGILNDGYTRILAEITRLRQDFAAELAAVFQSTVEVFHDHVYQPLRRQSRIDTPGMADTGHGLIERRQGHVVVVIVSHRLRLILPSHDRFVEVADVSGVGNSQVDPADRAGLRFRIAHCILPIRLTDFRQNIDRPKPATRRSPTCRDR
jgi:hypothetical protein